MKKVLSEIPNHKINSNIKVGIVSASWHLPLLDELKTGVISELEKMNIQNVKTHYCPGSYEIPFVVQNCILEYDVVLCLGLIIKGETLHFELISSAVCDTLMSLQLKFNKPIINNVLSCYNIEQAYDRCKSKELHTSLALSCSYMGSGSYL